MVGTKSEAVQQGTSGASGMMPDFQRENLSHDPIHGYIPFVSGADREQKEVAERDLIDHPWVQRMRHIHQLQTAWWVFPSAEHTRFQHILGAMHLGSRMVERLYPSLVENCEDVPSKGYVESLVRIAGLLHDVGHGPFGHFFDQHFLAQFGLTHETLGAYIIRHELGDLIRGIRRNPNGQLAQGETLSPDQVAWMICRPSKPERETQPRWLHFLRSLLSGIYTIDNMDFVLRDAFMSGYSSRAFDIERLIRYSFFTQHGLTMHDRGVDGLVRFMGVRAELFRTIYFHRTVRAIDLMLEDLFRESSKLLFPGNPLEHLSEYQEFTESSLLVDVGRWKRSSDPKQKELGDGWADLLKRQVSWVMVCQRTRVFDERESEPSSIFSDREFVELKLRQHLPKDLKSLPLRVDIARHIHRPHTMGPAAGQNYLYDSARGLVRALTTHEIYQRLPVSHRICRVYAEGTEYSRQIAEALDMITGNSGVDDATNM